MLKLQIKPIVDSLGMTRYQLAKELKIGFQAASNLYNGTTDRIYFDTLESLCNVLHCTPNDILVIVKDDAE